MARKSIEDVMNEIEDFLNSCKTTALSSNKIVVPRDEFDELFGDLKVKIPAEIDRCKKIMRNKEAILMDARKNADGILAQAQTQANQMISETEIMARANQQAYETVEMARAEANNIMAQAIAEANEIRLGSLQYSNDIMLGIRNYMQATMEVERANYENLMATLNNDFVVANANLTEIQTQITEFTGNPNIDPNVPQLKTAANGTGVKNESKTRTSVAQKMRQAVGMKEEKPENTKPVVDIPDFVANGEGTVKSENTQVPVTPQKTETTKTETSSPVATEKKPEPEKTTTQEQKMPLKNENSEAADVTASVEANGSQKKVKKKIVKKRNPVIHTPQTAQETVAKTVEAATANQTEKKVYKANGEQAREVTQVEGRVKRGPRVGRGMVEETSSMEDTIVVTDQPFETVSQAPTKSLGTLDDYSMEKKF